MRKCSTNNPSINMDDAFLIVTLLFFLDCSTKQPTHRNRISKKLKCSDKQNLQFQQTMGLIYCNIAFSLVCFTKITKYQAQSEASKKMFAKKTPQLTWMICLLYSNMALYFLTALQSYLHTPSASKKRLKCSDKKIFNIQQTMSNMAFVYHLLLNANYTPIAERSKQKMFEKTTPPLTWMICLLLVIWRFFLDCFTKQPTHTKRVKE